MEEPGTLQMLCNACHNWFGPTLDSGLYVLPSCCPYCKSLDVVVGFPGKPK